MLVSGVSIEKFILMTAFTSLYQKRNEKGVLSIRITFVTTDYTKFDCGISIFI